MDDVEVVGVTSAEDDKVAVGLLVWVEVAVDDGDGEYDPESEAVSLRVRLADTLRDRVALDVADLVGMMIT